MVYGLHLGMDMRLGLQVMREPVLVGHDLPPLLFGEGSFPRGILVPGTPSEILQNQ